jgi:beta-lactamase class A
VSHWDRVTTTIEQQERHGTLGVAIIAPDSEHWSHNGSRPFRAASIVKIPLMIEVYRAIERGQIALSDRFSLRAEDKTPGSGVLLHLHDGIELTLNDILYLMISISDNSATNLLIDLVGMEQVNATMQELGMTGSTLARKMRGRPANEGEPENIATPDDYASVVAALLDGSAASETSCSAMADMLRKQQNTRRIARFLPERDDVTWGSKTGSIAGVTNDVGFVTTPNGTMVIAVLCEGFPDQHAGELAIGEVTRVALDATGMLNS